MYELKIYDEGVRVWRAGRGGWEVVGNEEETQAQPDVKSFRFYSEVLRALGSIEDFNREVTFVFCICKRSLWQQ